jgi:hypothetical protein
MFYSPGTFFGIGVAAVLSVSPGSADLKIALRGCWFTSSALDPKRPQPLTVNSAEIATSVEIHFNADNLFGWSLVCNQR